MLEQAEQTAERLGAGLVTREIAECRSTLAAIQGLAGTASTPPVRRKRASEPVPHSCSLGRVATLRAHADGRLHL